MSYLTYALGEILLVVIEILIAVALNNWNQKRIDRQTERNILANLVKELEINLAAYDRMIEINKDKIKSVNELLSFYKDGKKPSKEEAIRLSQALFSIYTLREQTTIFEELRNTGKMDLIKDELRYQILDYYRQLESNIDSETNNIEWYVSSIIEYGLATFDYNSMLSKFDTPTPIVEVDDFDMDLFYGTSKDQPTKRLINTATFHSFTLQLNLMRYEEGRALASELKDAIEIYLSEN